eukprot:SM000006S19428  [mRNA]  locus=s6:613647:620721:- [translate_table: standard]
MGAAVVLAAYVGAVGGLLLVLLVGDAPALHGTPVHWCHRWLTAGACEALERAMGLACGQAGLDAYGATATWCCDRPNPLMQLFYLVVLAGGYAAFGQACFARIPGPYISSVHSYAAPVVVLVGLALFFATCFADPGYVKPTNVAGHLQTYPYDGIIYNPKFCETCRLQRQDSEVSPGRESSKTSQLTAAFVQAGENNCIGENNIRFFLAFLIWQCIICWYGAYILGCVFAGEVQERHLLDALKGHHQVPTMPIKEWLPLVTQWLLHYFAMPTMLLIFSMVVSVLVVSFFCYHLYLVITNTTTNEMYKWDDYRRWQASEIAAAAAASVEVDNDAQSKLSFRSKQARDGKQAAPGWMGVVVSDVVQPALVDNVWPSEIAAAMPTYKSTHTAKTKAAMEAGLASCGRSALLTGGCGRDSALPRGAMGPGKALVHRSRGRPPPAVAVQSPAAARSSWADAGTDGLLQHLRHSGTAVQARRVLLEDTTFALASHFRRGQAADCWVTVNGDSDAARCLDLADRSAMLLKRLQHSQVCWAWIPAIGVTALHGSEVAGDARVIADEADSGDCSTKWTREQATLFLSPASQPHSQKVELQRRKRPHPAAKASWWDPGSISEDQRWGHVLATPSTVSLDIAGLSGILLCAKDDLGDGCGGWRTINVPTHGILSIFPCEFQLEEEGIEPPMLRPWWAAVQQTEWAAGQGLAGRRALVFARSLRRSGDLERGVWWAWVEGVGFTGLTNAEVSKGCRDKAHLGSSDHMALSTLMLARQA